MPGCKKVYFRGCNVFREDRGRGFAEAAAKFFDCPVAGHTQWTGQNASPSNFFEGKIPTYPDFPGYEELQPGEKATWVDPPSNANKTKSGNTPADVKPQPYGDPPKRIR
jgi:hypothetical protein